MTPDTRSTGVMRVASGTFTALAAAVNLVLFVQSIQTYSLLMDVAQIDGAWIMLMLLVPVMKSAGLILAAALIFIKGKGGCGIGFLAAGAGYAVFLAFVIAGPLAAQATAGMTALSGAEYAATALCYLLLGALALRRRAGRGVYILPAAFFVVSFVVRVSISGLGVSGYVQSFAEFAAVACTGVWLSAAGRGEGAN